MKKEYEESFKLVKNLDKGVGHLRLNFMHDYISEK
jgi:hypothetical protein